MLVFEHADLNRWSDQFPKVCRNIFLSENISLNNKSAAKNIILELAANLLKANKYDNNN